MATRVPGSLLARALEASGVAALLVDVRAPDQPIVWCNAAFLALTGYAEAQVLGRNCRFLQGEDREQHGRHEIEEAIREGRAAVVVLRNYRADGSLFYNELALSPVSGPDGAVVHYIAMAHDISDRITLEDRLRQLASTDPLTGLLNRRRFEALVEREVHRAHRYGRPLVMLSFDLDRFKLVNDRHGHGCGDRVLVAFARCLVAGLRSEDVCARVGGEEFAALLPETSIVQGLEVAERLRLACAATAVEWEGQTIVVTVSIGATALVDRDDGYGGLAGRADAALYASKRNGRDRVTVA